MKTCLFLLLLLGGCVSDAVTQSVPSSAPMPVFGVTNQNAIRTVSDTMPDFPAPLASIRATNSSRMPYRDFLPFSEPEGFTNRTMGTETTYTEHNIGNDRPLVLRSKINTNNVQRQAIIADRVMLHNLYVQATNGDEHAKMNYHLLRTNEAFMMRLTNSNR